LALWFFGTIVQVGSAIQSGAVSNILGAKEDAKGYERKDE
jgi:hypothetical protein